MAFCFVQGTVLTFFVFVIVIRFDMNTNKIQTSRNVGSYSVTEARNRFVEQNMVKRHLCGQLISFKKSTKSVANHNMENAVSNVAFASWTLLCRTGMTGLVFDIY